MTHSEFENTLWGPGMECVYRGDTWQIQEVDFSERLVGLYDANDPDYPVWVRCENITIIVQAQAVFQA